MFYDICRWCLASLLYLDRIPTVLTLEEPENGVHPQFIRKWFRSYGKSRMQAA